MRSDHLFKLTISNKKTEVVGQGTNSSPEIRLGGETLKTVEKLINLGSTITSILSLDEEITSRIGKATAVFTRLVERVWKNKRLRTKPQILIHQTCVLSTRLYESEKWTLHAVQERRLNGFYMKYLRKILQIHWQDRIPDTGELKRAVIQSLYPIVRSQ